MANNTTELVFILDRSGSMAGLESDTIGGFNAMLDKQKQEQGEGFVTTVLFDDRCETLHDRRKLSEMAHITDRDYTVRGCTALLDAMGGTITHIRNIHHYPHPEHSPVHPTGGCACPHGFCDHHGRHGKRQPFLYAGTGQGHDPTAEGGRLGVFVPGRKYRRPANRCQHGHPGGSCRPVYVRCSRHPTEFRRSELCRILRAGKLLRRAGMEETNRGGFPHTQQKALRKYCTIFVQYFLNKKQTGYPVCFFDCGCSRIS